MPTATFLNLPPEKQERLMDAASREFASKPYNEASINRIIQEAGVPRGSFYMYFQDKEDLFRYLVQGYMDQMTMVLEEALVRQGGDVFAALLYLYDYITQKREAYDLGGMGAMAVIVGQNSGMQKNACWRWWIQSPSWRGCGKSSTPICWICAGSGIWETCWACC